MIKEDGLHLVLMPPEEPALEYDIPKALIATDKELSYWLKHLWEKSWFNERLEHALVEWFQKQNAP